MSPGKGTGRGRKRRPTNDEANARIVELHYQELLWAQRSEEDIRIEMEQRLADYFERRRFRRRHHAHD